MTKNQEKAMEKFKNDALRSSFCELKEDRIGENKYFVSYFISVGMVGDEGTLAVLARDTAFIFIGKKGGITYPVSKKMKNGNYKHYTKRLSRCSFLTVAIDQK